MSIITNQDILDAIRGRYQGNPNLVEDGNVAAKVESLKAEMQAVKAAIQGILQTSDANAHDKLDMLYARLEAIETKLNGTINVQQTGRIVKDYFGGNSTTTRSGFGTGKGFSIVNDGNADLTFTIGSITITVKPGEVFDGEFADFTSVTVTTTVAFRAIVRG